MSETITPELDSIVEAAAVNSKQSLLRRLAKRPAGIAALAFLILVVLVAVIGPLLAPHDPNAASATDVYGPVTAAHPLGTDSAGRDVLSRLLYGTRYSIAGAGLALVIAALLGISGGLVAGYYGRWFDSVSSWVVNLLQALPGIVILLAARAVLGPSVWTSMAIFGVLLSPAFFRLVYAAVTAVRNELYVDAARVSGLSDRRIISVHILRVVRAPALVQAAIVAGIAITIQAGLDVLGLGDLALPTWGNMLNEAFSSMYQDPVLLIWPSLAIGLTTISLVLVANSLRDVLERTGTRRKKRRSHAESPSVVSSDVIRHEPIVENAAEVLLDVSGIAVGYGQDDGSTTTVVQDVSLTVHRGEVLGLIGESGSGKTQTAWSILGLLPEGGRVTAGSIRFKGTNLTALSDAQMGQQRGLRIGYIPQEPMSNLDPAFTIGSQLVEPLRIKLGLGRKAARTRALELLDRVGIVDPVRTFDSYPHEVSGGMAQRVLIAGAVSCQPDLLIADEPTTALDVTVQAEILDLLRDLQRDFDMGVILVTHNFGVVADLCDTVAVMRAGRIIETGPVRELFAHPKHPYTLSLFDAVLEIPEARCAVQGMTAAATAGEGVLQ